MIDVMGEYHFPRDYAENWYGELCKMRAGGVTIVASYLFWIYHEEVEGEFCFDGDLDIRRFILCCNKPWKVAVTIKFYKREGFKIPSLRKTIL